MNAIYTLEESWSDDKVKFAEGREVFFVHEGDKIKELDLNGNLIKEFQIPEDLHDNMWNINASGLKLVYADVSENRLVIIDVNKGTIEKTPVHKIKSDIPNILALYYVDDLNTIFILSRSAFIAYKVLEKRFIRVVKNKWVFLNKDSEISEKDSKSFGKFQSVTLLKDYKHIMVVYQYKVVVFKLEEIGKCLQINLFTNAKMRLSYAFIPDRSILLITNGLSSIDVYHLESGKYISRLITSFNIIRDINFDESAGRIYVLGKDSKSNNVYLELFNLETYQKISKYYIRNNYIRNIYIVEKDVFLLEMYDDPKYGEHDYSDIYYYNLETSRLTSFMVAYRNTGWHKVGRTANYKIYDYIITRILPKLRKLIIRIKKRMEDKDYQVFALDYDQIIYNQIKDERIPFNYDLFKFEVKFKCAFEGIYVKGPDIDNDNEDEFIEFDENVLDDCVLEDLWIAGGHHTMPKYCTFRNCKFKGKNDNKSKSKIEKNARERVKDEFDLYFRGCQFENCLIEDLKFKEKFESSVFLRSKLVNTQFSGEISKGEFRECIFDRVEMNWYSGSLHTAIKLVDIKASDFAIRDVAGFTVKLEIEGGVFEKCSFKNLISIKINGRNAVLNGMDIENLKGEGFELDHCEVKNLKLDGTYFKNIYWNTCKFHDCEVLNSYGISVQVKDSILENFAIKDTGVLGLALLGLKPSECECNNFTGFFCNLANSGIEEGFKFKDSKLYYHNLNELKRSKSIIDVSEALKGLNTDETEKFAPIPPVYTTKFNHSWNLIEIASLDLSSINMEGAPLKDLVFKKCNLSGAKFSGCALEHIIFNESNLRGGDFTGAKLNNVKFTDADLDNINFASVKMGNCEILRSSMVGAKFSNANLNQVRANELILTGSDFSHSTLFDFSAKYIEIMENAVPVSFKQANLDQTYFGGSKLYECDFSEAAIGSLQIYKSNFNKFSFKGSEISELSINEMYEPKNDYKKIPKKIEEIEDYEQYLILDDATIKKLYLAKLKIKLNIKGTAKISEMTLRSIFLGESDIVMNAFKETKITVDYALYKGGSSKIPDVLLTQEYFITTELKKLQNKKEVREYLAEISKVFDKIMETPGIEEYTKTLSQFLWSHIDLLKRDYIKQFSKIMDNGIDWSSIPNLFQIDEKKIHYFKREFDFFMAFYNKKTTQTPTLTLNKGEEIGEGKEGKEEGEEEIEEQDLLNIRVDKRLLNIMRLLFYLESEGFIKEFPDHLELNKLEVYPKIPQPWTFEEILKKLKFFYKISPKKVQIKQFQCSICGQKFYSSVYLVRCSGQNCQNYICYKCLKGIKINIADIYDDIFKRKGNDRKYTSKKNMWFCPSCSFPGSSINEIDPYTLPKLRRPICDADLLQHFYLKYDGMTHYYDAYSGTKIFYNIRLYNREGNQVIPFKVKTSKTRVIGPLKRFELSVKGLKDILEIIQTNAIPIFSGIYLLGLESAFTPANRPTEYFIQILIIRKGEKPQKVPKTARVPVCEHCDSLLMRYTYNYRLVVDHLKEEYCPYCHKELKIKWRPNKFVKIMPAPDTHGLKYAKGKSQFKILYKGIPIKVELSKEEIDNLIDYYASNFPNKCIGPVSIKLIEDEIVQVIPESVLKELEYRPIYLFPEDIIDR